jgi:hypothetical protein
MNTRHLFGHTVLASLIGAAMLTFAVTHRRPQPESTRLAGDPEQQCL